MTVTQTWTLLNSTNLRYVPETEGVYQLSDNGQSIIYIGRSDNLQRRLIEHLNTDDPCIRTASYFQYETTRRSAERERELLEEYRRLHGRYPRCNDRNV